MRIRAGLVAAAALFCFLCSLHAVRAATPRDRLRVLPEPQAVHAYGGVALRLNPGSKLDAGAAGVDLDVAVSDLKRRWRAIGIIGEEAPRSAQLQLSAASSHVVMSRGDLAAEHEFLRKQLGTEGYVLTVSPRGIRIEAPSPAGAFYAIMTLAQLPQRDAGGWYLPNAVIADWPAMRWRGLSDDVSRGPIPTMDFFKDRIRTLAEFKMNLYSPYMEHVFADPQNLLPTPLDAITPEQLRELARYAASFHVSLMPEQETLGHMHHTIEVQRYAGLAEVQHDAVLAPAVPGASRYAARLVSAEGAAVRGFTPFFHLGGDEPFVLGTGKSKALLARVGWDRLYADYFAPLSRSLLAAGMRPVLWSDYLLDHRGAIARLPKNVVVANWKYDVLPSYTPLLQPFAAAGIEQFVSPGDANWSEIYPDITDAQQNVRRFVRDGQRTPHVIGMLDTVWNDDGQTLFSATWYPVLFAASAAWQSGMADPSRYADRFAWTFFGTSERNLTGDIDALRRAKDSLNTDPGDNSDYQFWADPFAVYPRMLREVNVPTLRLHAEDALDDLLRSPAPPLHADATRTMRLAAMRFDLLGRQLQIAQQFDASYADAVNKAGKDDDAVNGDLYNNDGLLSEWLEQLSAVERLYAQAWLSESRPAYLANNLALYDERRSEIVRIDKRLLYVINEQYERQGKTLPPRATLF